MIQDFISFLEASPVNYLACAEVEQRLTQSGFRAFDPASRLTTAANDRFFVTKNGSAIFAFEMGSKPIADAGFHLICAHCDSPTFRIKPAGGFIDGKGILRLNVEAYGGAIYSTWFDRALSLAGRVIVRGRDALHPEVRLLAIRRPLMTIPNLCIHFNRNVNNGVNISVQENMQPIYGWVKDTLENNNGLKSLISSELDINREDILDFDLYLYDTQKPCTLGIDDALISAGRLDDLEMVYCGLEALRKKRETPEVTNILAIFDNEETGSHTSPGAGSPFLAHLIERIVWAQGGDREDYFRAIEKSYMISADNAHGYHPNYGGKSDPLIYPVLGGGPVIKYNAAQKYASHAQSAAIFEAICKESGVPCQKFVNHSDIAGGSTLGNILTSSLPINGVDMGAAILAMHSIRELGSVADIAYTLQAFETFYNYRV